MREWEWKRVCLLWKQFFFFPCRLPDKISGTPWGFPYTSLIEIKGSVRRTLDIKIIFFKKRQKLVIFFCIITSSLCLYFPVVSYSSLQFVENKNQRRFIHYVWLICLLNFNLLVILFFFSLQYNNWRNWFICPCMIYLILVFAEASLWYNLTCFWSSYIFYKFVVLL